MFSSPPSAFSEALDYLAIGSTIVLYFLFLGWKGFLVPLPIAILWVLRWAFRIFFQLRNGVPL